VRGAAGQTAGLSFAIEKSIAEVMGGLRSADMSGVLDESAIPELRTVHGEDWLEFHYGFRSLELWCARLVFEQEGLWSRGRVSVKPARPRLGRAALRTFLTELLRAVQAVDPEAVAHGRALSADEC
jgi:hypothetical protein